jgi:DNA-binding transcriptional MerR regulator
MRQILFYRELDLSLDGIKVILNHKDFDALTALRSHKAALLGRVERLRLLLGTVDKTIAHLEGNETMNMKGLFEGFSEKEQEQYALEAEQMYDPETVRASNRKWKATPPTEKERILAECPLSCPGGRAARKAGQCRCAGVDRPMAPAPAELLES